MLLLPKFQKAFRLKNWRSPLNLWDSHRCSFTIFNRQNRHIDIPLLRKYYERHTIMLAKLNANEDTLTCSPCYISMLALNISLYRAVTTWLWFNYNLCIMYFLLTYFLLKVVVMISEHKIMYLNTLLITKTIIAIHFPNVPPFFEYVLLYTHHIKRLCFPPTICFTVYSSQTFDQKLGNKKDPCQPHVALLFSG